MRVVAERCCEERRLRCWYRRCTAQRCSTSGTAFAGSAGIFSVLLYVAGWLVGWLVARVAGVCNESAAVLS